jgi:hypothetical protein
MFRMTKSKFHSVTASFLICLFPLMGACVSSKVYPEGEIVSPFNYDTSFRDSVMKSWNAMLEKQNRVKNQTGRIVVQFHLTYDGNITDMKVLEDSIGNDQALLCQNAILSGSPYPSWPKDMIRMVGANYRVIT